MWYNKNDEILLEPFYEELHKHLERRQKIFRFYFENDLKLIVKYDCEADSDNGLSLEDENYEEFYEIYFEILKVEKKPKESKLRKGKYVEINYHNLPTKWEVVEDYKQERVKQCDCCLNITLPRNKLYRICPDCGWRDDWQFRENPDMKSLEFSLSLNEAREKWKKYHKNIRD